MKGLYKDFKRKDDLRRDKHSYNLKYHTTCRKDGDESAPFIQTLSKIPDRLLPTERNRKARQESRTAFREHFVSRLNEYLDEAKEVLPS